MLRFSPYRRCFLLGSAAVAWVVPSAATAQSTTDPAVASGPQTTAVAGTRVYTPADFARFAPKNAQDMLVQVPSFSIRGATQERGLGQASENVLINGQRVANKSGGAIDQLQRVPAGNVERIEILDAATLGIAGLSGQVANVVVKQDQKSAGQFEYNPHLRARFAKPSIVAGSLSYTGEAGPLSYTLSIKNDPGRGAFGGPIYIYDGSGVLIETRREIYRGEHEHADMQVKLGYDGPGSSLGNLTLGYKPHWNPSRLTDERLLVTGERRSRDIRTELDGRDANINADYEFAVGRGRLKLIGVRQWEREPLVQDLILTFDTTGAADTGTRFSRDTRLGETILRSEYGWKTASNDWQVSLERAFNSLDQEGRLFELNRQGEFVEVDFPQGTGKVTEVRYEGIGTLSRPLTSNLDVQLALGGEISRLDRVDDDQPARNFFRPKGSINLAWRPSSGWEVSLKLRRRVGQISFYDFLAQPKLSEDRENAGNPDLVPPQSWEVETEVARDLGRWGKTRLRMFYHRVADIIDVIPIGENGQGIGNLPRANRLGFESVSTFQLDSIGWTGAKLDLTAGREWTSVKDPLTGEKRPISGVRSRWANLKIRHDIPSTPFAWSAYAQYNYFTKYFYLTEIFHSLDLPFFVGFYVEHKNVLGTTVRLSLDNLVDTKHKVWRTVHSGYRDRAPVSFFQKQDQAVGPIFSLSIKGNF